MSKSLKVMISIPIVIKSILDLIVSIPVIMIK